MSASANTATGPIANQELEISLTSRPGRCVPASTSGSRAAIKTTGTAIGMTATGIANNNGTKANCVATVNPNGVSNRTRVARTMTIRHNAAGRTANACGGRTHQSAAAEAMNPRTTAPSVTRSRGGMIDSSRRNVPASSSCSSRLGVNDINLVIGQTARTMSRARMQPARTFVQYQALVARDLAATTGSGG